MDGTTRFICLNYVNSTAIALSALDSNDLPLLRSNYMTSFTRAFTDNTKGVYSSPDATLSSLYLIELHPERVKFEYDNILQDKDGTKRHEKMIQKMVGPSTAQNPSDEQLKAMLLQNNKKASTNKQKFKWVFA